MANKIRVKLILELRDAHMSRNSIAATRNMSRNSVSEVIHLADEMQIRYEDIKDLSEDEVYQMFFPDKYTDLKQLYTLPNYDTIHGELKKVGVTLKLLWKEYKANCESKGNIPVGYSKFCDDYATYVSQQALTNHLVHKPGVRCEVDWSGPTMKYVDTSSGEIIKVYLFVATLPYSQYSYVEPCLDMKQDTWLRCHIHMYQFFGGVPVRTVCDNLKTGVIKHPKEGDILLNEAYESLGNYYCTAIMPTGVRKPKQKASVEGTVGKIATAIIATLRNEEFYSLGELKMAVNQALKEFNETHFQKRDGSRYTVYLEEKPYLHELPAFPFEIAEWKHHVKVYPDCHIVYDYSDEDNDFDYYTNIRKGLGLHFTVTTKRTIFFRSCKNKDASCKPQNCYTINQGHYHLCPNAEFACKCGTLCSAGAFDIDHIKSFKRHWDSLKSVNIENLKTWYNTVDNLQILCKHCNRSKGAN